MLDKVKIRQALKQDQEAIWSIIRDVIKSGDTYIFNPDSSKSKMLSYWLDEDKFTYVAELENIVIGTFFIKSNYPDLGSHVANASYMIDKRHAGKGIGFKMGEFSLMEAKRLGYKSMQFNLVIKNNNRAIKLWKRLGFKVIGEAPEAFNNPQEGFVNALLMWRRL